MPILKTITAPNGASVSLHKITRIELSGKMLEYMVAVGSWPNEEMYLQGKAPVWNTNLGITASAVGAGLIQSMEQLLLVSGLFSNGQIVALPEQDSLEALKLRKRAQINDWRLAANRGSFPFAGEMISCNEVGRSDIDGMNGSVTLNGALPASFPGVWKTDANNYVPIPDVLTWKAFYAAMVQVGMDNFNRSEGLKTLLESYTTAAEVAALDWSTALPGA